MEKIELENGCYKEIEYYGDKKIKIFCEYYFNSNFDVHRLDGPAEIWYRENGEIESEDYFINDIKYSKEEFDKKINIERNLKLLNKV